MLHGIWHLSLYLEFTARFMSRRLLRHTIYTICHVKINVIVWTWVDLWEWAKIKICLQSVYSIVDSNYMRKIYPTPFVLIIHFPFFVKYLSSLVKLPEGQECWVGRRLWANFSLELACFASLAQMCFIYHVSGLKVMCLPLLLNNGYREWLSWQQWAKLAFINNVYCTCFLL